MMAGMTHRLRVLPRQPDEGQPALVRAAAVLLLVAVYALLSPLAAATPPDPSWVSGLYDDSDFDNVVAFIGGLVGVSAAPEADRLAPDWREGRLAHSGSGSPDSTSVFTLLARSPPQL